MDETCKYFLYPFVENELIEMTKNNNADIEDVFIGEGVLKLLNDEESKSATIRIV